MTRLPLIPKDFLPLPQPMGWQDWIIPVALWALMIIVGD